MISVNFQESSQELKTPIKGFVNHQYLNHTWIIQNIWFKILQWQFSGETKNYHLDMTGEDVVIQNNDALIQKALPDSMPWQNNVLTGTNDYF